MKRMKLYLHFFILLFSITLKAVERPALVKVFEGKEEVKPLFEAAAKGDIDTLEVQIMAKKVDINARDNNGNTPLFYAKNLNTLKTLVKHGANINAQNDAGITPLDLNVVFGRLKRVKFLLDQGANPTIADTKGVTPLHFATMISYFENPKILKAGKATAVGVGTAGAGALVGGVAATLTGGTASIVGIGMLVESDFQLIAATGGAILIVEAAIIGALVAADIFVRNRIVTLLLQKGANPNAQDADGNTPLHILAAGKVLKPANRHGGVIMAQELINKGAQRDIKNKAGQTPYDVAKEYKRSFQLLRTLNPAK